MASTSGVVDAATRSLLTFIRRSLIHRGSMYVNAERAVLPFTNGCELFLPEVQRQVIGEDLDLLVVDLGAVLLHRHDDIAPLRARVVAAQLCYISDIVARGAGGEQNLLALALGQIVLWRCLKPGALFLVRRSL